MPPFAHQAAVRQENSDDDHLSARDFKRIADLIGEEVGIKLPPTNPMIYAGLVAVLLGFRLWRYLARRQSR